MPKNSLQAVLILAYYNVTLFQIFSWLLLCNIFHVCYCATVISFVLLYDYGPPVE